jgi:hypothetical protein
VIIRGEVYPATMSSPHFCISPQMHFNVQTSLRQRVVISGERSMFNQAEIFVASRSTLDSQVVGRQHLTTSLIIEDSKPVWLSDYVYMSAVDSFQPDCVGTK